MADDLATKAASYVERLCGVVPDRHVGSAGNNEAVDFFEETVRGFGWEVVSTPFDCLEWEDSGSLVESGGTRREVRTGPYSLPCDVTARLSVASTIDALEQGDRAGTILVLHGEVAAEQLFPRNFEFYNPEEHRRVYAAIERQGPAAVLAVTGRNPGMAGALYPFPLIEDGDFDIPNAYVSDVDGAGLVASDGVEARLAIGSRRIPATSRQLVARKAGTGTDRVVVFAHIDGRKGIPAALDNASGAASLLVLAEILRDHAGPLTVEIVPLNGEDYYGANGQVIWMRENREKLGDIVLGMNADDAGHVGARTGVSMYGLPEGTEVVLHDVLARYPGFIEGPQWPQGDHSLFAFNGVPAVAFTAEDFMETFRDITHTPKDRPELVDPAIVADVARFAADIIAGLGAPT